MSEPANNNGSLEEVPGLDNPWTVNAPSGLMLKGSARPGLFDGDNDRCTELTD